MEGTPVPAKVEDSDAAKAAAFWWHLDSHASLCDTLANSLLKTEGATEQEIREIWADPWGWINKNSDQFAEWHEIRQRIDGDYNPVNDPQPHITMRALNTRAALHTINAIHHLTEFRLAQAAQDAMTASASLLNAWNHLYVTTDELSQGARTNTTVIAPALVGKKGGDAKSAADPKTKEKEFVFECWQDWRSGKTAYASKAAFARDMLEKCTLLTSQKNIEDWCRAWDQPER